MVLLDIFAKLGIKLACAHYIKMGDAASYGLRNHPARGTRTTAATLNGATGAQWLGEITDTLRVLHASNFRVGSTLYVNWDDWFYAGNTDYSTQYGGKTIAQRVIESSGVDAIIPASRVNPNEIIAVVKRNTTIRVLSAMPISTFPLFRANAMDDYVFKTIASASIEIIRDMNNQCGIAHSVPT